MENMSSGCFLVGFRFIPTDQELLIRYRKQKPESLPLAYPIPEALLVVVIHGNLTGDLNAERYFFSMAQTKHRRAKQSDRKAPSGYWKATVKKRRFLIPRKKEIVTKRKLLFSTHPSLQMGLKQTG
ncbi:NAC domain-containing protein 83-like [Bidens hawaiensis]|uniref:NAC domain-containing protein 83-like n=1 Tax=Bidens hawaiensis TaxID=980011 RepID=UPI00404929BF